MDDAAGGELFGAAVFRLARARGLSARASRERPQRELRKQIALRMRVQVRFKQPGSSMRNQFL